MTPDKRARKNAFVAYLQTLAYDPRVRAAGMSLAALRGAVLQCVGEDLLSVGRDLASFVVERARPFARSVAADTVGDARAGDLVADALARGVDAAFGWVEDLVAGRPKRS